MNKKASAITKSKVRIYRRMFDYTEKNYDIGIRSPIWENVFNLIRTPTRNVVNLQKQYLWRIDNNVTERN